MSEGYRVAYHGTLRNTGIRLTLSSQFQNNYFTEMCSGSEAGAYVRLIDRVYHSTLGLRVIKKRRREIRFTPELSRPTLTETLSPNTVLPLRRPSALTPSYPHGKPQPEHRTG